MSQQSVDSIVKFLLSKQGKMLFVGSVEGWHKTSKGVCETLRVMEIPYSIAMHGGRECITLIDGSAIVWEEQSQ